MGMGKEQGHLSKSVFLKFVVLDLPQQAVEPSQQLLTCYPETSCSQRFLVLFPFAFILDDSH